MADHAVIVHFDYGSRDLSPLFELEDRLEAAIEAAQAGEYDGNEIAVEGRLDGAAADALEHVKHACFDCGGSRLGHE